jgi:hypothetical protein
MSEQAIASLALVSTQWDQGGSYTSSFVPLVAECLRTMPQVEVSLPQLQRAIATTFGFQLPQGTLKTLLRRAVKQGYARAEHGIYRRNDDALAALDFAQRRAEALRQCEALVDKLVGFCKKEHQTVWTNDEAESSLFAYIRRHHIPLLTSIVEGAPVPGASRTDMQTDYLIGTFISHLCKRDPDGFRYLETVVKGSMLANALFFPDLGKVQQRFGKARIYLDTQLLLRALGEAGPDLQAPCTELLDLLYALSAEIRCFEQTVDEVGGILEFVGDTLRHPEYLRSAYGEVLEYYVQTGRRATDADLALVRLDRSLSRLRVRPEPMPSIEPEFALDEQRLAEVLREMVRYTREQALLHDLQALRSIHCLRHGSFPTRFEECDAVFVTTNTVLVRASKAFFREEYGDEAIAVPHCITEHMLTTLAWLKKPQKAPDLARKVLIANCYAALQPSDNLWKMYTAEIARRQARGDISDDEFHILRFSNEAREVLMDLTLGDPDAFAEGTPQEVLARAKDRLRADDRAELAAEVRKRKEAEQAAGAAVARSRYQEQRRQDHLKGKAIQIGMWGRRVFFSGCVALQIVGVCLVLWPSLLEGSLRWPLFACLVLLAVLQGADFIWGKHIKALARQIETAITGKAEQVLIHVFAPREDSSL